MPFHEEKESQRSSPTLEAPSLEKRTSSNAEEEIDFPDGGFEAWMVVVGGVICNIVRQVSGNSSFKGFTCR
jgi:hypothetical protein